MYQFLIIAYLFTLHVPEKYRNRIEKLILKNKNLFASKDSELGHTDTVKMKVDTGDTKPIETI